MIGLKEAQTQDNKGPCLSLDQIWDGKELRRRQHVCPGQRLPHLVPPWALLSHLHMGVRVACLRSSNSFALSLDKTQLLPQASKPCVIVSLWHPLPS